MLETIELIIRWVFAAQLIFWGLNGFFHFAKIPPAGEVIAQFSEACIKTKFIMPTVKILEVVCGILLITHTSVCLSLLVLSPIVFVIFGLQFLHNKAPWPVLIPFCLPYLFLFWWHCRMVIEIAAE